MSENDDHIQRKMDRNVSDASDADQPSNENDIKSYQLVFDALTQEPTAGLSYGFSFKVERMIFKKKQKARQKMLYAALGVVAILFVVAVVSMLQNPSSFSFWELFPVGYLWPLCFGTGILLIVQLLEFKRLKHQFFSDR